jgi:hypothetical protein
MRYSRRLVVPLAVTALVAGGGLGLGLALVANANVAASCTSNTNNMAPITCSVTDNQTGTTIDMPTAVKATVTLATGSVAQDVGITYQMFCSQGGASATTTQATAPALPKAQAISTTSPVTDTLVLGEPAPDNCTIIDVTATLYTDTAATTQSVSGSFGMEVDWTPATPPSSASPTASASSSSPPPPPSTGSGSLIKGYGGKCLDDKGNSSANRAKVIIWTCNGSDRAQKWTFSNGQLKHNGKCLNDPGNGGSGSKLILWTCGGSSNGKWFHGSRNGEYVLVMLTHGLLCLTDPGYSKTNGTQLVVFACHNTSNQHWT